MNSALADAIAAKRSRPVRQMSPTEFRTALEAAGAFVDIETVQVSSAVNLGPLRWRELHERALRPVLDEAKERTWLSHLADGLGLCSCQRHWAEYLRTNPPDFANYYAWSVAAHNAVNARLGKSLWRP